ncbi:MAG: hypothetical protein JRG91_09765 [Deltaproteobacteria bacterium]|nr:hypothetical protein [Deltaproteobacteria bacterium]
MPYTLALAFWVAVLELVVNRGFGAFALHFSSRGPISTVLGPVLGLGLFLSYFGSLLCLVLSGYVMYQLIARPGFLAWWRKASTGVLGLGAIGSVAAQLVLPTLVGKLAPERVVSLIVTAQVAISALVILLSFSILAMRTGLMKRLFATVPVLILLVAGVHQFFYFYPLSMPAWMSASAPGTMLVVSQALALAFPFPVAAYLAYQHMKHGLPVFIHVLVAISGFFPCLVLANMPSPIYRDVFFAMLGMRLALPAAGILYPLAVLPLLFIFSSLVGTPVASRSFMLSRRRAGFGIGLIYLGTFTPLSSSQAAFLMLGLILWMKSIVMD